MHYHHIHYRLGNQMFTYAYAKGLSNRLNIPFCLSHFGSLKYFQLFEENKRSNTVKKWWFKLFLKPFSKRVEMLDCGTDYQNVEITKHALLKGFWQSEKYWKSIQHTIYNDFQVLPKFKINFEAKWQNELINSTSIVLHIRRTDYANFPGSDNLNGPDLTLPESYYLNAINNIIKECSDPDKPFKIFVASDNPNQIKSWFSSIDIPIIFSHGSEIEDFQLIQHADYPVIANSSFSWWAAYLNQKAKKILAPQYFLGFKIQKEWPESIYPSYFEQIPVY